MSSLASSSWAVGALTSLFLAVIYCRSNDAKLQKVPEDAAALSQRWTDEEILDVYTKLQASPVDIPSKLPPKTGRRYIVVGGAGFMGGFIVLQLLWRGESPRRIRVLDLRKPTREDLKTGDAALVDYRVCDVSDEKAVQEAFDAPWPEIDGVNGEEPELTVFHPAASIRFYERIWPLVSLSAAANVRGVQHVIDNAKRVGATVIVHTSSGSICVRRTRFWLWPWEKQVPYAVQHISDDDENELRPTKWNEFFSNYAYSKWLGESIVRAADRSPSGKDGKKVLRTGSLRPGNSVYGPGDMSINAYMKKSINPTFVNHIVQNFIHVENAAFAHLCFEAKLIPDSTWETPNAKLEDVGGQAFCISDAGPPPSFGDIYKALGLLSNNQIIFPRLSQTFLLFVSHTIELWYNFRTLWALYLPYPLSTLHKLIPNPPRDAVVLQPPIFALVAVHLHFDHSRAVRELGYEPFYTTLQGVCATFEEHERAGRSTALERSGGMTIPTPVLKLIAGSDMGGSKKNTIGTAALGAPHRVGSSGMQTPQAEKVGFDLDMQAIAKAKTKHD